MAKTPRASRTVVLAGTPLKVETIKLGNLPLIDENGEPLLTISHLCDRLGIKRRTLFNYMAKGMPYLRLTTKTVRFKWPSVETWFRAYTPMRTTTRKLRRKKR